MTSKHLIFMLAGGAIGFYIGSEAGNTSSAVIGILAGVAAGWAFDQYIVHSYG